ncbi:MAG: hypothetical protein R3D27_14290 [Hyphomicrobiaceae bacterium]
MSAKIIVMITMLAMPNGESVVHVKPFATPVQCIEAANIEASDPFVANVECAELDDGVLMLRFGPGEGASKPTPPARRAPPAPRATS